MAEQVEARVSRVSTAASAPATAEASAAEGLLTPEGVAREVSELRRLAQEFAPECATLGVDAAALQRRLDGLSERLAQLSPPAPEAPARDGQPEPTTARTTLPARRGRPLGTRRFGLAARGPGLMGGAMPLPGAEMGPFQLSVQSAPAAELFPLSPLARLAD